MPTLEEKSYRLAQFTRSQMLRPGYELTARMEPSRHRVAEGLMMTLARHGMIATQAAYTKVDTDARWAEVSAYFQRPVPVIVRRIDAQAWDAVVGQIESGAFYRCVDSTLAHPDGGFYWRPEAVTDLDIPLQLISSGQLGKMEVLYWLGVIGGVHSGAGHVPDEPTVTLTTAGIYLGESATLVWESEAAAELEIDHDVGAVLPRASGAVKVSPTVSTTYRITATGPAGTTPATADATVVVVTVPAAPVLALQREGGLFNLSWTKPAGPVYGYRLEQSFDGVAWRAVEAILVADNLSFVAGGGVGISLHFRVIALGGTGESLPSNVVTDVVDST